LIDQSSGASPYSFTNVGAAGSKVSDMLPQGTGSVAISDESVTVRDITVTVQWVGRTGAHSYSIVTKLAVLQ
jgi:hypothetical protein